MTQLGGSAQVDARGGAIVGGGYTLRRAGTVSVNPPSIALSATGVVTITSITCLVGDLIFVTAPDTLLDGLSLEGAAVTDTDEVKISIANHAAADPADDSARVWAYLLFSNN